MTDRNSLRLGDRVILKPQQMMGRVTVLDWHADPPYFVFDSLTKSVKIPVDDTKRWRPLMSTAEADEVERLIQTAEAIEGVVHAPGTPRNDAAVKTLDKYLAGGPGQRITAYATLLDWAVQAQIQGEEFGLWRGLLSEAEGFLLGELAHVRGTPYATYQRHLIETRQAADCSQRVSVADAPKEPEASVTTMDDWPDHGSHGLGILDLGEEITLFSHGWEMPEPDLDLDYGLRIPVASGKWNAWMFIRDDEEVPSELEAATERSDDEGHREELLELFQTGFRRSWLVLAHESRTAMIPEPSVGHEPSIADLDRILSIAETTERDGLRDMELATREGDGPREQLTYLGDGGDEYGHSLAIISGTVLRAEWGYAIRSLNNKVVAWPWGLAFDACPVPVYANGQEGKRTFIALPFFLL